MLLLHVIFFFFLVLILAGIKVGAARTLIEIHNLSHFLLRVATHLTNIGSDWNGLWP